MKPIATETNDFETLRAKGQIYVDKTAHLHRMIADPSRKFFFCARRDVGAELYSRRARP